MHGPVYTPRVATDVEQRLADGLAQLGLGADATQVAQLRAYQRLLQHWNRAFNLTSITDPDDMVVRHLLDSASVLPFVPGPRVLDAGTGGGLPGIVLALLAPALQLTLLDSVEKKVRFLRQAQIELGLKTIAPVHAKLETWASGPVFDTIVSRAFASLAEFASLCGRFLAPGGQLVAMKGRHPADELAALPAEWTVHSVTRLNVPGLAAERHVVVLER